MENHFKISSFSKFFHYCQNGRSLKKTESLELAILLSAYIKKMLLSGQVNKKDMRMIDISLTYYCHKRLTCVFHRLTIVKYKYVFYIRKKDQKQFAYRNS